MKAHISIRSISWGIKYGIWLGRKRERSDIVKYVQERIEDFGACTKNDCCSEHIYVLEGIVEDINDKQQ